MKKSSVMAIGLSLALLSPAVAQPIEPVDSAGGWEIFRNEANGGCFMERVTEQDIVLQIGSVRAILGEGPADAFGYLGIFVPGEAPEVISDTPIVLVGIGPNTYIGQAALVEREGYHGGVVVAEADSKLAWDLQNRKGMSITTSNGGLVEVDLLRSDIKAGVEAVKKCQRG